MVLDFTKLLRDEDEEVLQALIPSVAGVLELFTYHNILQRGRLCLNLRLVIFTKFNT